MPFHTARLTGGGADAHGDTAMPPPPCPLVLGYFDHLRWLTGVGLGEGALQLPAFEAATAYLCAVAM